MTDGSRFLVRFALREDLRFLSHLDLMRLFERACRRAGLPLRFSQGFNPRPMVHLPVPHVVGVGGEDEPLLLELTAPAEPAELAAALNAQLPHAAPVLSARPVGARERFRPEWADYRAVLPEDWAEASPAAGPASAGWSPDRLCRAVADAMAGAALTARRSRDDGRTHRSVDIRRFVLDLAVEGTGQGEPGSSSALAVRMRIAVTDAGTTRPTEMLGALGLPEACVRRAELVRTAVQLRCEPAREGTPPKVRRSPEADDVAADAEDVAADDDARSQSDGAPPADDDTDHVAATAGDEVDVRDDVHDEVHEPDAPPAREGSPGRSRRETQYPAAAPPTAAPAFGTPVRPGPGTYAGPDC